MKSADQTGGNPSPSGGLFKESQSDIFPVGQVSFGELQALSNPRRLMPYSAVSSARRLSA